MRLTSAVVLGLCLVALVSHAQGAPAGTLATARLASDTIEVLLHGGMPVEIRNRLTGDQLISAGAQSATYEIGIFGSGRHSLGQAVVRQQATDRDVFTRYEFPDGTALAVRWSVDVSGDLVIVASGRSRGRVDQLRFPLLGCNVQDFQLVAVTNFGVGVVHRGPWHDPPENRFADLHLQYVHPLVALFEGQQGGFFVEGRCPEVGPANMRLHGNGDTADITFIRGMPRPTYTPEMFEIRIRAYQGKWQSAVDPYVDWMEHGLGMVPLERREPAWVRDIYAQTYVDPREWVKGEGISKLERMAKELDPHRTLLGKVSEYRPIPEFGFDHGYPDYTPTEEAVRFFRRAKEHGFRISVHVNTTGLDMRFRDLLARFRPGLRQTGTDALGEPVFWGQRFANAYGPVNFAYCSTAYKPWRDYLVDQLKDVVDAGADMLYLDESHTPTGAFMVDGKTSIQGVMALQEELLEAYPHVAIQVEQFNPMNARHASFALTSKQPQHPLSGYLFHRFLKVCAWYGVYQVTDEAGLDAWERWGFLVPGAESDPAWLEIAGAFQRFKLQPDPSRELDAGEHSAFRGSHGVRAAFVKRDGQRGLLVRHEDGTEEWLGRRAADGT